MIINFIFLFFVLMTMPAHAASVSSLIKDGNEDFLKGQYERSLERYGKALEKQSESDIVNFNAGAAYYKKEDYQKAIEHFQKSLLTDTNDIKFNAYYNLGNALYKDGMTKENQNIDEAIASLEKAIDKYENAKKIKANDTDLDFNTGLVRKELDRLKKKKEQQSQNKNNQQQENKDKKQEESPSKQNQDQNKEQAKDQESSSKDSKDQSQQEQSNPQDQNNDSEKKENSQEEKPSGQTPSSEQKEQNAKQANENKDNKDYNNSSDEQGERVNVPENVDRKQAEILLKEYEQNEEPQGLLKMYKPSKGVSETYKDW